jgi:uncharacterized protein YodC (DUF2158 family)
MTQAFKVGDRVQVLSGGYGVVTYGPVNSTFGYHKLVIVKQDGDEERAFKASDLKPAAKSAVGDRVRSFAASYTIEAGPFYAPGEWYAVKSERTGGVMHSTADELSLVARDQSEDEGLKPGDVVRIPRDELAGADVRAGDLLVVKETEGYLSGTTVIVHAAPGARQSEWYFESEDVERVDPETVAVVDNVAYDLTARYRDRDGDVWSFERRPDGTVRGKYNDRRVSDYSDTIDSAVHGFGPLTRV